MRWAGWVGALTKVLSDPLLRERPARVCCEVDPEQRHRFGQRGRLGMPDVPAAEFGPPLIGDLAAGQRGDPLRQVLPAPLVESAGRVGSDVDDDVDSARIEDLLRLAYAERRVPEGDDHHPHPP